MERRMAETAAEETDQQYSSTDTEEDVDLAEMIATLRAGLTSEDDDKLLEVLDLQAEASKSHPVPLQAQRGLVNYSDLDSTDSETGSDVDTAMKVAASRLFSDEGVDDDSDLVPAVLTSTPMHRCLFAGGRSGNMGMGVQSTDPVATATFQRRSGGLALSSSARPEKFSSTVRQLQQDWEEDDDIDETCDDGEQSGVETDEVGYIDTPPPLHLLASIAPSASIQPTRRSLQTTGTWRSRGRLFEPEQVGTESDDYDDDGDGGDLDRWLSESAVKTGTQVANETKALSATKWNNQAGTMRVAAVSTASPKAASRWAPQTDARAVLNTGAMHAITAAAPRTMVSAAGSDSLVKLQQEPEEDPEVWITNEEAAAAHERYAQAEQGNAAVEAQARAAALADHKARAQAEADAYLATMAEVEAAEEEAAAYLTSLMEAKATEAQAQADTAREVVLTEQAWAAAAAEADAAVLLIAVEAAREAAANRKREIEVREMAKRETDARDDAAEAKRKAVEREDSDAEEYRLETIFPEPVAVSTAADPTSQEANLTAAQMEVAVARNVHIEGASMQEAPAAHGAHGAREKAIEGQVYAERAVTVAEMRVAADAIATATSDVTTARDTQIDPAKKNVVDDSTSSTVPRSSVKHTGVADRETTTSVCRERSSGAPVLAESEVSKRRRTASMLGPDADSVTPEKQAAATESTILWWRREREKAEAAATVSAVYATVDEGWNDLMKNASPEKLAAFRLLRIDSTAAEMRAAYCRDREKAEQARLDSQTRWRPAPGTPSQLGQRSVRPHLQGDGFVSPLKNQLCEREHARSCTEKMIRSQLVTPRHSPGQSSPPRRVGHRLNLTHTTPGSAGHRREPLAPDQNEDVDRMARSSLSPQAYMAYVAGARLRHKRAVAEFVPPPADPAPQNCAAPHLLTQRQPRPQLKAHASHSVAPHQRTCRRHCTGYWEAAGPLLGGFVMLLSVLFYCLTIVVE